MMRTLSGLIARHRRPILIVAAALVAATLLARVLGADPDTLTPWLFLPFLAADLLYLLILAAPSTRHHPDAFEVDGAGFHTPRSGNITLAGVAHLCLLGALALYPSGTSPMGIPLVWAPAIGVAALALYPRALWHGVRLTITPDGLRNDKYAGTVTIPWQSITEINPTDSTGLRLRLSLTSLDQITVTGWTTSRRTLEFDGAGLPFVAATIRHYLANPADRLHIGTPEEHRRLHPAPPA
ncbi:PH domain-containing protein [Actinoplanes sp. CA-015351]|uniref:PH domain-containing protein n=1 Tax=Actinoplanes sp. CA-015351 TaxID=3239897 RepID=UPI003D95B038